MEFVRDFPTGARFEVTETGMAVISREGERTEFDLNGKMLSEPKWFKHFFKMGAKERKLVKKWYEQQKGVTESQIEFLDYVKEAIDNINYSYFIATLEPSITETGKLYYKKGHPVCHTLSPAEWLRKAEEFAAQYNSRLASAEELILWYAYRAAKGYWTLEEVCCDNSDEELTPDTELESSGARKIGGERDGVKNTFKLVKGDCFFWEVGTAWFMNGSILEISFPINAYEKRKNTSGVIVLQK